MSNIAFADCGGPFELTAAHTISSWESQPTTEAETAVIAFLEQRPQLYAGKRLLHVGVGNCSLPVALVDDLAAYVGLTISLPEKRLFEEKFAATGHMRVLLTNKYDPRDYSRIDDFFDLIIDVNLKSFACCEKHFNQLMALCTERLKSGATLITAESGVLWGWAGNTNVAHTPGAQVDPSLAEDRVLGLDGLKRLSRNFGLDLTWVVPAAIGYAPAAMEKLWLLSKA
jgi:hypothetical protein